MSFDHFYRKVNSMKLEKYTDICPQRKSKKIAETGELMVGKLKVYSN